MALADRLGHEFTIQRFAVLLDDDRPIKDDWEQTKRSWSDLATVAGWMQPMSAREQADAAQGGPVLSTHRAYMLPTDVRAPDRISFGGAIYEIDQVVDAAGKGHHLELLCHTVGV